MRKKIFFLVFLLGGIYLIVVLTRDLGQIIKVKDRLTEAEARVNKLETEKNKLTEELKQVDTEAFVEQEARNKLMLVKPGEAVVLIPKATESGQIGSDSTLSGFNGVSNIGGEGQKDLANWQKWARVFGF